jgi:hypothetical protein
MPISRPLLIVLIVAVVGAVGFYATQGSRDAATAPSEVVTPAPPAAEKAATPTQTAQRTEPAKVKAAPEAKAKAAAKGADQAKASVGIPVRVERALDDRKQVVLFFYNPGSADDRATARAVAAVRGPKVAVFTDPIGRLASYRKLIGELGISQAPAVVIVAKDRTARVVEGFVDPATLAQDVADAR